MANNIRGITIEIGGDTTKLGKALENSEKKSRSLQTELRAIQQSLKFNPDNVEMLTQKQEVLSQAIAETSDKLDTLKEAEKQVIKQFERGEVAEEQVRALQREILKTENQLESMSDDLRSTSQLMEDIADGTREAEQRTAEYRERLDEANQELEEFKGKAGETFDTLKTGALALGTATIATAGYALNLSTEFDKAFNTLKTQTGASAEEMDSLNESMENIYKSNLGESIEDVAISMATVKTQTKLTGSELENTTKHAILMRDVFGFEVNESIRAVNSLMNQFGITSDEAYTLIAQGAQNGLDQNGDLLDTINEYAVQFKGAGYDAEDMFNMLVNGAESGTWSVDKLGDAVKEYNIRMTDGTANEYLEKLGLNVDEITSKYAEGGASAQEANNTIVQALKGVENEQERYIIGQGIMGTMWEDLGEEAIYALLDTEGAINKTSDALEDINNTKYDDIGSALQGLGRTLQTDVIEPLGDELKPVVEDAIEYVKDNGPAIKEVLSNIVKSVGEFVRMVVDNKDTILATISAIGAGFLAWKVVTIIGSIIGAMKSLITIVKAGELAWGALNIVMKANIIGIIIGAITALVAGFIYLWNNCDAFREFWLNLWETIKNAVSVAVEAVVTFFSNAWSTIVELWTGAKEWFSGLIDAIVGFFSDAWTKIVEIWSAVVSWFAGIWSGIVEVFSPAIEWFSALFTSIYDTLASIIAVIIELIKGCWTIITTVFGKAYSWFNSTVITPVKNAFSAFWSTISNLASGAWSIIQSVWSAVSGWFNSTIVTPVSNFFSNMWTKLKEGAVGAWTGIKSVFSNVTIWFRDKFSEAWTKVKNIFSTGGKIFTGITEGITSAFKKVVNGIIKGINKVVSVPFNAINDVLNTLRNAKIAGISPFSGLPSVSVPQIPLLYRGGILKKGQTGFLEGNGAEAVVPLEKETGWINRIAQKMNDLQDANRGGANLSAKMDEVIRTMKSLKSTIVLDTGTLVGETINQIDDRLQDNYTLKERGV